MTPGMYVALGLLLIAVTSVAFMLGIVAIAVASSLGRRRKAIQAARRKAAVAEEIAHPADDLMAVADAVAEPPPCGEAWQDEVGCYRPGPHGCALIGGHRIHRCVCGALVIEDPPRPVATLARGGLVDTWQPAAPGDTPGALVPGEDEAPPRINGKPYTTDGMVKLGRNTLCRACVDHRTNGRYSEICDSCRPSLVGSARGLS